MVFMCTLLFDRGVVGFASPDHAGFLGADSLPGVFNAPCDHRLGLI